MRKINIDVNDQVLKCPKCENNTEFEIYSNQVSEDGCEVFAKCKCGYDPTFENPELRFESVMGGTSDENARAALFCWNDAIMEAVTNPTGG